MAKITFKGNEVNTNGSLPAVGAEAPDFKGVKSDLSELHLKDLKGKKVVINVFPSLDTAVCAASVRRFMLNVAELADESVCNRRGVLRIGNGDGLLSRRRTCGRNRQRSAVRRGGGASQRSDPSGAYLLDLNCTPKLGRLK